MISKVCSYNFEVISQIKIQRFGIDSGECCLNAKLAIFGKMMMICVFLIFLYC